MRLVKGMSTKPLTANEIRFAINMLCEKHDYNPFEELIKLATEIKDVQVNGKVIQLPSCTVDQRIAIAKEIAPYLAPKMKNIEVKQEISQDVHIFVHKFTGDKSLQEPVRQKAIDVKR
jgi:uncharacterized phage protein gp47/JayE